jgi:hypothetical protein
MGTKEIDRRMPPPEGFEKHLGCLIATVFWSLYFFAIVVAIAYEFA